VFFSIFSNGGVYISPFEKILKNTEHVLHLSIYFGHFWSFLVTFGGVIFGHFWGSSLPVVVVRAGT
jgi:hypothetical protein